MGPVGNVNYSLPVLNVLWIALCNFSISILHNDSPLNCKRTYSGYLLTVNDLLYSSELGVYW